MDTVTALVRSIFQKESLDECSLEELQAMAHQYSYFTPVQFLLAEKLKTTNVDLYKEQLQKLSLHFNNPLWLDYLLNPYQAEELAASAKLEEMETINGDGIGRGNENVSTEANLVTEENEIQQLTISQSNSSGPGSFELIKDEISESTETTEETTEQLAGENNTENVFETPGPRGEETNQVQMPMPPLPELNQEPAETELSFQPYHTVDYFASQGIKFIPEEKPTDRFGKQLKSFTEWLKTMKRLPQSEAPRSTDIVSEQKVEQMAEHSIDAGEVITETMAEVWIKQGNNEKAIETYNKLSLLNPDKSAYFASLAEQLKNS
jgi:hypothetical protein